MLTSISLDQWRRSFSGTSDDDQGDISPSTPSGAVYTASKNFSFPPNRATSTKSFASSETDITDSGDHGPFSEKSLYADAYTSKDRLAPSNNGGWRTEYLGASEKAFQMQRPSIVALPVYPSPSGTLGRSWKLKAKKVALGLSWITVVLSNAATWFYLALRIQAMIDVESKISGVFVGGWAFLVLETLVAVIMCEWSFFLSPVEL